MNSDNLSISEIRTSLSLLETQYSESMDSGKSDAAFRIWCDINTLTDELYKKIASEDPYTTEADARYFENNG